MNEDQRDVAVIGAIGVFISIVFCLSVAGIGGLWGVLPILALALLEIWAKGYPHNYDG